MIGAVLKWIAGSSGGVAQLGERLVCNQEVIGSIPFTSTTFRSNGYDKRLLSSFGWEAILRNCAGGTR